MVLGLKHFIMLLGDIVACRFGTYPCRIRPDGSLFPKGDQPTAIEQLVRGFKAAAVPDPAGATGTGKTFTMANVIAQTGRPALGLAHNKPWRHSFATSCGSSSSRTPLSILFHITTIISRRLTYRSVIPTSQRRRR